ncbi:MAG: hypothetical protein NE330_02790 [Lentisphaeraceae bacterium]|nr:hypothetical protein [Lentisphaeraceae bacterium]
MFSREFWETTDLDENELYVLCRNGTIEYLETQIRNTEHIITENILNEEEVDIQLLENIRSYRELITDVATFRLEKLFFTGAKDPEILKIKCKQKDIKYVHLRDPYPKLSKLNLDKFDNQVDRLCELGYIPALLYVYSPITTLKEFLSRLRKTLK